MGHGELNGVQIMPRQIAAYAYEAGWRDAQKLTIAVAVCLSESQGFDRAIHYNDDGSHDLGMWQINLTAHKVTEADAYDPEKATHIAYSVFANRGHTFNAWAAYTSGVYLHDTYLRRATRGVGNYLAELFKERAIKAGNNSLLPTPLLDYRA